MRVDINTYVSKGGFQAIKCISISNAILSNKLLGTGNMWEVMSRMSYVLESRGYLELSHDVF